MISLQFLKYRADNPIAKTVNGFKEGVFYESDSDSDENLGDSWIFGRIGDRSGADPRARK